MKNDDSLLLRGAEVAELLNVSRAKAYRLMQHEVIPTVRMGGCIRVPREALLRWIDSQTKSAA